MGFLWMLKKQAGRIGSVRLGEEMDSIHACLRSNRAVVQPQHPSRENISAADEHGKNQRDYIPVAGIGNAIRPCTLKTKSKMQYGLSLERG
jgi:hypothetical protein